MYYYYILNQANVWFLEIAFVRASVLCPPRPAPRALITMHAVRDIGTELITIFEGMHACEPEYTGKGY